MFGIRTPTKNTQTSGKDERAGPSTRDEATKVRRSIGEWEKGKPAARDKTATSEITSPPKPVGCVESNRRLGTTGRPIRTATTSAARSDHEDQGPPKQAASYKCRTDEARACLNRAKFQLHQSRNIKTEIKQELMLALDRLYKLVKESEENGAKGDHQPKEDKDSAPPLETSEEVVTKESALIKKLEEHAALIKENTTRMANFSSSLDRLHEKVDIQAPRRDEETTYASVAAKNGKGSLPAPVTLHSVVVTSKNELETGEEVLQKIRMAVKAKEGGIAVDKIRKAKDQKIIMGCRSKEEREKVIERIRKSGAELAVEEVKNKDPLVIFRDVLSYNTDDDILQAINNQNASLLEGVKEQDREIIIRFRKKTRNPHVAHVIARVSPAVWRRLTEAGTVSIDLQRVRVEDHSPLIQCSLCLGYGHGKRHCREKAETCCHCGGNHLKAKCTEWAAGMEPSCTNCVKAKADNARHNAFSDQCPVRIKWDALARAAIAYC